MKTQLKWSFKTQNTEHRVQSTEYRTQNTEHRIQNTEHRTQSTEHRAQNPEHRTQKAEHRIQKAEHRQWGKGLLFLVWALLSVFCFLFFIGCATPSAKLPPPPPKYVEEVKDTALTPSANSLWVDRGSLFEDMRARRVNDIVTINIVESLSGSGKADTETSRESTIDYELTNLFGMNKDFNLHNVFGLKDLYKGSNVFEPVVKSSAKSEFKGEGDTNREGSLIATITAKVVEVLPNGNLVLEARKELTINNEKQILVLTGIARPEDISSDNTILSSKISDAQVYYVGDGVVQDKQGTGWFIRFLDKIWPF
jgi:flagellar L-ring protein precursor FlgH